MRIVASALAGWRGAWPYNPAEGYAWGAVVVALRTVIVVGDAIWWLAPRAMAVGGGWLLLSRLFG